jgi:hypothetical protein
MNRLNEKAQENLSILLNLKEGDNLCSYNGKLQLQDEYVQVDNTTEIEYSVYLTFNQLLFWNNYNNIYNDDIIRKIDKCIDVMYDNKQFEKLIETDNFLQIIEDIEEKLDTMKERLYYDSPFFTFFKHTYRTFELIKYILKENNEYVKQKLQSTNIDFNREYFINRCNDNDTDDNSDEGEANELIDGSDSDVEYMTEGKLIEEKRLLDELDTDTENEIYRTFDDNDSGDDEIEHVKDE